MVKSSKILNPADKARKEARKKELKKNKKQRQQVRSAVIESKDPEQVIAELEKLDKLEFDISTNPTMCDTIYKEKRKRLNDIWSKILAYYAKEDPDREGKLKKDKEEYDNKHRRLAREFEAIKAAQEVKIEDVFLPPEHTSVLDDIPDDDPLLSDSVYITPLTEGIKPPGCPPGLPPDLSQLVESVKTSLVAPTLLEPLALPANLINLHLSQSIITNRGVGTTFTNDFCNNRSRTNHDIYRYGQQNYKKIKNNHIKKPESARTATKVDVIESKPVIFKPKAARFVPSSVRSKLNHVENKSKEEG